MRAGRFRSRGEEQEVGRRSEGREDEWNSRHQCKKGQDSDCNETIHEDLNRPDDRGRYRPQETPYSQALEKTGEVPEIMRREDRGRP